jgi:cyclic di-GMP phosphodiesterase
VHLVRAQLEREGYAVFAASRGQEALDNIAVIQPDLVLLDVMMPGIDGFETCRRLKSNPQTRLVPVVLVTALREADDRIRGIDAGADDFLTKPFNPLELSARVRSLIRIKRYTDDLDSAEAVIVSLALTIEARDQTTEGHCQRLATYAAALGAHLGLGVDDLEALERGAFLHDIGKIGVPDAVLMKRGRLTPGEFDLIKSHTIIGDRLCGELRLLKGVRPIVRSHHERLDGTGYPDGLRGHDIPLLAQIVSVVDIFAALTTRRPYKEPYESERAYEELSIEVARGWRDRDLVGAFISLARQGLLPRADAVASGDSDTASVGGASSRSHA